MLISKKFKFSNLINFKIINQNNVLKVFFYSIDNKIVSKISLNASFYYHNNKIFLFNKSNLSKILYNIVKNFTLLISDTIFLQYNYFIRLNVIGLGYKNFILNNKLYLLIGDANYIVLSIPPTIKVFCKKRQIYILGLKKDVLFDFSNKIKALKKINYYKGKGILEFRNFKFMKLKVGKKQRFM